MHIYTYIDDSIEIYTSLSLSLSRSLCLLYSHTRAYTDRFALNKKDSKEEEEEEENDISMNLIAIIITL